MFYVIEETKIIPAVLVSFPIAMATHPNETEFRGEKDLSHSSRLWSIIAGKLQGQETDHITPLFTNQEQ